MNEGLFIDYVDIEWCLRARHRGYESFGVFAAHMRHSLGDKHIGMLGKKITLHTPARYYYQFRNPLWIYRQPWTTLNWVVIDACRLAVRFVIYALPQAVEQAQVQEVEARFGEALRLSAFALSGREAAPGDIVQVALFWEATEAPAERYRATVQLLDEEWQVLAQRDAAPQDDCGPYHKLAARPGPITVESNTPYMLKLNKEWVFRFWTCTFFK